MFFKNKSNQYCLTELVRLDNSKGITYEIAIACRIFYLESEEKEQLNTLDGISYLIKFNHMRYKQMLKFQRKNKLNDFFAKILLLDYDFNLQVIKYLKQSKKSADIQIKDIYVYSIVSKINVQPHVK